MKVRNGFVSNSSSSSFVIDLDDITAKQLDKILNHIAVANTPSFREKLEEEGEERLWADEGDAWDVYVSDGKVRGSTIMDNFSMHTFLRVIGVDMSAVNFDEGYY